jgi:alpha-N-arabinofuranosidase
LQCLVQTDPEAAWPTPTYRVFDLYAPHIGGRSVRTRVETTDREVEDADHDVPLVGASASTGDDGAFLTVSNRDLAPLTVEVDLGVSGVSAAEAEVLFADDDPDARSTRENADAFAASDLAVDVDGSATIDLPPASVAGVWIQSDRG